MTAAFAHDLLEARHDLGSARGLEIAVGFVMAFIASALVVKPFLNYVRRSGFAPFAWYRIALGLAMLWVLFVGRPFLAAFALDLDHRLNHLYVGDIQGIIRVFVSERGEMSVCMSKLLGRLGRADARLPLIRLDPAALAEAAPGNPDDPVDPVDDCRSFSPPRGLLERARRGQLWAARKSRWSPRPRPAAAQADLVLPDLVDGQFPWRSRSTGRRSRWAACWSPGSACSFGLDDGHRAQEPPGALVDAGGLRAGFTRPARRI